MKKPGIFATLALLISFSLTSCQKSSQQDETVIADEVLESESFDDGHTSQTSLDYMGTYKGILPCADCEGIETVIELESGNSYIKRTVYLGKNDQKIHESSGTYTWNDAGNTITLINEKSPNQYFVGEGMLFQLDMDGKRIEGELADNYRLIKE